ncbi:DUF5131 family protein (plasmid) [Microtetraspora malaysiensis]|uniref:DUF5131 family protein n=1 Tax=Microtetraspora malaysiensis TaxID=161358 RepID=UPI003D8AE5D7
MGDKSTIEWTQATWNPLTGCTKVSSGCDNCYAETIAHRFAGTKAYPNGFEVTLRPDRLDQPLRWKKPRRIFVNSMADLFHDAVPDEYIAQVFAVMAASPHHTFQMLTKRHGRMRSLLSSVEFDLAVAEAWSRLGTTSGSLDDGDTTPPYPLPNVWIGVSVEDQKRADLRIPALLDTPAAVRWISAEPLLGPIDMFGPIDQYGGRPRLNYWLPPGRPFFPPGKPGSMMSGPISEKPTLDWVVVGGESGSKARPMHPGWARSLRDQCHAAGVPFFFKQWGTWAPGYSHGEGEDGPGDLFVNPDGQTGHAWFNENLGYPTNYAGPWGEDSHLMSRVGKNAAGNVLDGCEWSEYPQPATTPA